MHLHLEHIILTHFRNYDYGEAQFCPGLNCFTGSNGMGKTNLLDAIHYLCMCKSRINALDRYVIQHGADFMRLEGHFIKKDQPEKVVAKVIPAKSKVIERNNVPYDRFSQHIGLLPVVIILPDDTAMVREGSEERRRFLDNTLSQLDAEYLKHIIRYNKLLRQRNAFLKQEGRVDEQLLATYDDQMAASAQLICTKRQQFIHDFQPLFKNWYSGISMDAEEVGLRYRSQLAGEHTYLELMQKNREKDLLLQRTTIGIHKDDLIFTLAGKAMKRFASQGQLKSYVLSLGLARFEMLKLHQNTTPILLLDDIFDKLDRDRVTQMLELLSDKDFGQIFLTDTHIDRVQEITTHFQRTSRIFNIKNATIQEL